jgi:hypothetical protein
MAVQETAGRARRAPAPKTMSDHATLAAIVARFQAEHPVVWERIRLGPTHHGIDQMIETLEH